MHKKTDILTLLLFFTLFFFTVCQEVDPVPITLETSTTDLPKPSQPETQGIPLPKKEQIIPEPVQDEPNLLDSLPETKKEELLKRKQQILKLSDQERREIIQNMIATRKRMNKDELGSIFDNDPLQDNVLRTQQVKDQLKIVEEQDRNLNPWISSQLDNLPNQEQILTREDFAFIIKPSSQFIFKWNPSKRGNFKFIVKIYQLISDKDLTIPQNPDEDQFIQVSAHSQMNNNYQEIGRVYISKMFSLDFYSDYQIIRMKNFNDGKVVVEVSLESTVFVLEQGVRDDIFILPAKISSGLVETMKDSQKKQEKMFKSEWSFRDREQRHQSEMLILTGVELVVILGTAIVQMWCIKELLDNRIIV